jgi:hypothetical protein
MAAVTIDAQKVIDERPVSAFPKKLRRYQPGESLSLVAAAGSKSRHFNTA